MATPTLLDRPDGSVQAVNLKRLNEIPYFLCGNLPLNTNLAPGVGLIPNVATISVPPNQSSQPTIMSVSGEGPAQITHFSLERFLSSAGPFVTPVPATDTGKVLLQLQDGQQMRALSNGAVHVDTIFGSHDVATNPLAKPYPLPEALYIDEQRSLIATFTDLANAYLPGPPITPVNNNFRPSLETQRYLTRVPDSNLSRIRARMDSRQYLTMPYFYVLDNGVATLPGVLNSVTQATITVGQDHHFELMQLSAVSTGAFAINITNIATGESIIDAPLGTNQPVQSALGIGTASYPLRFHEGVFVELRSKLLVTLINLTGAVNNVYLTLAGRVMADRMWQ